ncbi:TIGR03086 family metal-binding protein [Solicola gregarius]|uniref:TIGR03086 family metal-binding protein n=1 Tax=Solicola gregarius TaxID=2908642 RepID=A0AA46YJD4_9ACTN|nr:TIGR03086 family metal-binding protein [Solicola gregarius]UYM03341.1 TIGR03086 family metal-binding protein [Solicola gregarius]
MSTPTSPRDRMPAAAERFTATLHAVGADRWDAPTPCSDWDVRALVRHVTSEQLWAPHLLRGEMLEQVGDRYDGDVLGDDPIGVWDAAIAGALEAWLVPASDDMFVHVSVGQISVREYAAQMLVDLTVHCWDLARGAGQAVELDPDAVAASLAYTEPRARHGGMDSMFARPVPIDSADPIDRLLALTGRDPAWRVPPAHN